MRCRRHMERTGLWGLSENDKKMLVRPLWGPVGEILLCWHSDLFKHPYEGPGVHSMVWFVQLKSQSLPESGGKIGWRLRREETKKRSSGEDGIETVALIPLRGRSVRCKWLQ